MGSEFKVIFSSKETADVYFEDKIVRISGELGLDTFLASSKNMKWMQPDHLKDKTLTASESQEVVNLVKNYYKGETPIICFENDKKKARKSFIITNPPITFWLCLCILGLFLILIAAETIFSPPPHTVMYICITIFIFIPGTMVALWTKAFCIKVSGTKIWVRKRFGFITFEFDVSDIASVEWKINETKFRRSEKIIVLTSKGKKIPIETLMVNSDKMINLIEENVDKAKIKRTYKKFK